jgi:hypothetical protein
MERDKKEVRSYQKKFCGGQNRKQNSLGRGEMTFLDQGDKEVRGRR